MSTITLAIFDRMKLLEQKISLLENENKNLRSIVEAVTTTSATVSTTKAAKEYSGPGSTTTSIPGDFVNPTSPKPPSSKRPILGVSGALKSPTTFGGILPTTTTAGPIDVNPTFPETPETPGISVGGVDRTPITQGGIPATTTPGGVDVNPTFPETPGPRKPVVGVSSVARAPATFGGGSPSTTIPGTSVNVNPTVPTGTNVPGTQSPQQTAASFFRKSGTSTKDVSSLASSRYLSYK